MKNPASIPKLMEWITANPEQPNERKPFDRSAPTSQEISRVVHLTRLRVAQLEASVAQPISLEDQAVATRNDEELDGLQKNIEESSAQSESHLSLIHI